MDSQKAMSQDEIKAKIVAELNIGHLADEEQTEIVSGLSQVLLDGATLAVMKSVPEEELRRVDELTEAGQGEAAQALILKAVPNAQEVMMQAISDGLNEYKQRLAADSESSEAVAA